jgi:3-hydroxyethyl bacteriochlorophyllide a dehydrogenase
MQANAVVFSDRNVVEYQTVDCPDPGSADVVVQVTHSWISNGTEGSYLRGERIAGDTPIRSEDPHPFPIVAGYQKIGVVDWVGDEVTHVTAGESVFVTISKVDNMFSAGGGHISPAVTRGDQVWKLPSGLPPLAYSGLVLTQVGYNCGARAPLEVGAAAVVLGDGMVGQWAAQTLAWRGARVVLLGHHEDRLDRFSDGPRRHRLNTQRDDWVDGVQDALPEGIDVLVDTVGSIDTVEALVPMMRRSGHTVSAGFYGPTDRLALQPLRAGEQTVHLVSGWTTERINATLDLVSLGYLETLPLITHHFPVQRAADAWELINSKREDVLGVILDW